MKRIWSCTFGVAILVLLVVPALVQAVDTPAPAAAVCLIGDHPGIPESDALTAAMLVCDELRKQGISVGEPVYETPVPANVYRVVLRRLGEKIFVRLSQENPIGTVIVERQMTLANIEEMIPAAPRLVNALIHRKPINSTVDIESVTEHEARELRKISGESLWNMGIFGISMPGTDITAKPALGFGWSYETPSYAAATEFRFRIQEEGDRFEADGDRFSFFSWSIGGSYFLNKRNFSPYVGGGLALVGVEIESTTRVKKQKEWFGSAERYRELWGEEWEWVDEYSSEGANGMGAYVAIGIEALRLTESRLKFELRMDRPFFKLPHQDTMPITFGVSFSRNYVPGSCCLF